MPSVLQFTSIEMGDLTKKYKKVVLVAPDGGWGYLICVSVILIYTITTGVWACFGILHKEFIHKLEIGSSTVTLITGANAMCAAFSGFLTSPLLNILSFRSLALLACVLYNAGCLGAVFANSIVTFFICQSILQGAGLGLFFNLAACITNNYFVKKRLFVTGIIQTSTAILSMGFPLLLNKTYNYFGYRGSLVIVSALSLHLFIAVALMQPVEWHLKIAELPETEGEMKSFLVSDTFGDEDVPTVKMIDIESLPATDKNICEEVKNMPTTPKENSALMKIFKETFDIDLLKSFLPSYACLGVVMSIFADFVTSILLPQILYAANWTQEETAFGVTMMTFGDLFSRIVTIFGSKYIKIKNKQLHMIGVAIAILPRIGLLLTKNVTVVLVQLFVMGVGRCFITTILPLIISDDVPPEKFTAAMGMVMLLLGVFNLSLGSAAGAVRDLTGTYDTIIWISLIFLILTTTQGLLETFCLKRHKNSDRLKS